MPGYSWTKASAGISVGQPAVGGWTKHVQDVLKSIMVGPLHLYLHTAESYVRCSIVLNPGSITPVYGLTWGLRISSRYLMAVRLPQVSTWRTVGPSKEIPINGSGQ